MGHEKPVNIVVIGVSSTTKDVYEKSISLTQKEFPDKRCEFLDEATSARIETAIVSRVLEIVIARKPRLRMVHRLVNTAPVTFVFTEHVDSETKREIAKHPTLASHVRYLSPSNTVSGKARTIVDIIRTELAQKVGIATS